MNDTFEFTLNNPLTEEQWDMITDVDMERTDSITFHTKHGKEVEFAKVRHGKWKWLSCTYDRVPKEKEYECSECHHKTIVHGDDMPWEKYCPNCGAKMDGRKERRMIDLNKFPMHKKPLADSTLKCMKRKEIIEYVRCIEHNYEALYTTYIQSIKNAEMLLAERKEE